MTVSSISDLTNPYQANQTNSYSSVRQDMNQLSTALGSGNISDAQSAFADLMQNLKFGSTTSTSSANSTSTTNPITTDLQSLQSALKSGDVTAAQKALATLQKDMQTTQGVKKGHHHHHKVSTEQTNSSTSSSSSTNSTSSTTSTNPFQDLINGIMNMQSALNSGNISGAQNAFDSIQVNPSSNNILVGNNISNQVLQTLQNSFQSGDVNAVQNSYSSFIQKLQNSFNGNAIGNIVDVKS